MRCNAMRLLTFLFFSFFSRLGDSANGIVLFFCSRASEILGLLREI